MPFSGAQVTRLGLSAIPRGLYGDFSGKIQTITIDGNTTDIAIENTTGTITGAEAVAVVVDQPTGGFLSFWDRLDEERARRRRLAREREELEERRQRIQDERDREIAAEITRLERVEARNAELARLTRLAERYQAELRQVAGERVRKAADRAIEQRNFSAMEALERELYRQREEEEFLMMAAQIVLNQ